MLRGGTGGLNRVWQLGRRLNKEAFHLSLGNARGRYSPALNSTKFQGLSLRHSALWHSDREPADCAGVEIKRCDARRKLQA